MSSTTPLTDSINALISYANETTGQSDTQLGTAVTHLVEGYGGGGSGGDLSFTLDSSGNITEYVFGMDSIPPYVLNYVRGNASTFVDCKFSTKPTHIGNGAFYNAKVYLDWSGLSDVVTVDEYAFATGADSTTSASEVELASFVGYTSDHSAINIFRTNNTNAPKVFRLPAMTYIPQYAWYGYKATGLDITIGSIGTAVTASKSLPFGNTSSASGTVTIYTTADYLDSVKSAVENGAGSNIAFVYKASEATTYSGTSYSAGDTITV